MMEKLKKNTYKLLLVLVISLGSGETATFTVGGTNCNYLNIQDCIDTATAGDSIEVREGVYHENVLVDKKLTFYGEGEPVIDASGKGSAFILQSDGISLSGFTIIGSRNQAGQMEAAIKVTSGNNTICNNTITGNDNGIILEGCNDSTIMNNRIYGNQQNGIYLHLSQGNILERNTVNQNGLEHGATGINLHMACVENSIRENEVHGNGDSGIIVSTSDNNVISRNNISGNGEAGIHLNCGSFNNTVTENNASENNIGIYLTTAYGSWIYLNSFINNDENVRSWSSTNFWSSYWSMSYRYNNSSFLSHTGNYWSEYSGRDLNGDGIGEEPYTIGPDSMMQAAPPDSSDPIMQQQAALMAMHSDFTDMDRFPLMIRYESYDARIAQEQQQTDTLAEPTLWEAYQEMGMSLSPLKL